ncbi:formate/nitrite transporter family protein [Christensenellaceae bacterium OttesenSCG-928-L17]|nr:formate/nitrite transporter family protein [Christensenellaceae bacterium OttesenSCG-928-L17]
MNAPNEIAANYVGIGKKKTEMAAAKLFLLGILAGMFIAFAAVGANTASSVIENPGVSKLVGALLFPAGLAMVLIAGSELFTGNNLIIISVLEKQASFVGMLRNWLFVYLGNFVGALLVAWLVNGGHQLSLFSNALAGTTINTATAKASLTFGDAFLRGVMCNFLVCIAVWMSFSSKDIAGKVLALYFPVMLFVLCGFEHSVANMYYVPAGIFALGNPAYAGAATADIAKLTWGNFFMNNLLPVTLGNIVGGAGLVGLPYWFLYLKKKKA